MVRSQSSTQFKIPRSSSTSNSSPQFDEFTKPEEKKGEDKRFSSLDGRWEKIDTSQVEGGGCERDRRRRLTNFNFFLFVPFVFLFRFLCFPQPLLFPARRL